jgi:plastocyanin
MKKIILIAFALYSGVAFSNKVTIINSGFVFSPDSISLNLGDTLIFQLGSIHNAVEVSQTTWNLNGTSALPEGFSTPFTGGQITGLTAGMHYYVCTNHAFMGMKGRVYVNNVAGENINFNNKYFFAAFPNPTNSKISIQTNFKTDNLNSILTIYNITGEKIVYNQFLSDEIDFSAYPKGIYLLEIIADKKSYITKVIVE